VKETAEAARFQTALAMAETGIRLMRQNLRRRHPHASVEEIDEKLRHWLADRPMDAGGDAQPPRPR
jgi:hypothetical protein